MVNSLLQILIVGSHREIDVVTGIDSCGSFLDRTVKAWQLVDGGIVADNHTIEAQITAQDILQYLTVSHTVDTLSRAVGHRMITGHHGTAASQTDHRLVGQEDFFHQLFLLRLTTTAIAQIMLGTGTDALLQVALLQSANKRCAHHGREVGILAIRLFQTVETGCTAHIDHWRERQYTTHLAHSRTRLACLQLSQLRIERAGLSYLLRIDGSPPGIDARQHLFVEKGGNAVRRMVHQPVLDGSHTVAQHIGVHGFLTGILGEMAYPVRNQLTALGCIQLSLFIEEIVHKHTFQLGDALFFRHVEVKLINLLFHVDSGIASYHECSHTHHHNNVFLHHQLIK